MKWPLPQDFNEAVQNPATVFSDPDLKTGETVTGPQGLPLPHSGNFADVYHIHGADGRDWAVKCFTRQVSGLAQRYAQVADTLSRADLPFTIGFTFLADGIWVRGEWRPVIKMEWVEGTLLNLLVEQNAARSPVLSALSKMWVRVCQRLRGERIAHADIQHGNVLLVPGNRPGAYALKLIDYDGMYVPSLSHTASGEAGHPNFQHPDRASTGAYSPDLDRFPNLVVATALKATELFGPGLWQRYDNGDNLLFVEADFHNPGESSLMRELWASGDPGVRSLVGRLAVACGRGIAQTPWLDDIAPDGEVTPLSTAEKHEAESLLGGRSSVAIATPSRPPVEETLPPDPDDQDDPPPSGSARLLAPVQRTRAEAGIKSARRRSSRSQKRKPWRLVLVAVVALLIAGASILGVRLLGAKKPPANELQDGTWAMGKDDSPPGRKDTVDPGSQLQPKDSSQKETVDPGKMEPVDPDSQSKKKDPPQKEPVSPNSQPQPSDPYQKGTFWIGQLRWSADRSHHNYTLAITERTGKDFKGFAQLESGPKSNPIRTGRYDLVGEVSGLNLKYNGDVVGLSVVEGTRLEVGLQIHATAKNGGVLSGSLRLTNPPPPDEKQTNAGTGANSQPDDPYQKGTIWAGPLRWNNDPGNHSYTLTITERTGNTFRGLARQEYKPTRTGVYKLEGEVIGLNLKYKGEVAGLNEVDGKHLEPGLQIHATANNGGILSGTLRLKTP